MLCDILYLNAVFLVALYKKVQCQLFRDLFKTVWHFPVSQSIRVHSRPQHKINSDVYKITEWLQAKVLPQDLLLNILEMRFSVQSLPYPWVSCTLCSSDARVFISSTLYSSKSPKTRKLRFKLKKRFTTKLSEIYFTKWVQKRTLTLLTTAQALLLQISTSSGTLKSSRRNYGSIRKLTFE